MASKANKIARIVAKNVRAERIKMGLSQQKLAEKTGLSVRYISRLESDPQNLKIDKIASIAEAVGVPPGTLLSEDGDRASSTNVALELKSVIRLLESIHSRCANF